MTIVTPIMLNVVDVTRLLSCDLHVSCRMCLSMVHRCFIHKSRVRTGFPMIADVFCTIPRVWALRVHTCTGQSPGVNWKEGYRGLNTANISGRPGLRSVGRRWQGSAAGDGRDLHFGHFGSWRASLSLRWIWCGQKIRFDLDTLWVKKWRDWESGRHSTWGSDSLDTDDYLPAVSQSDRHDIVMIFFGCDHFVCRLYHSKIVFM